MAPRLRRDERRARESARAQAAAAIRVVCDRRSAARRIRHGPGSGNPKALKLAGLSLDDIAVIELNEAFAAQSLAVIQQAGLDAARVNPNGGAIALGHPLGCTGAKLTATLARELQRKNARYGMVTMCIGGGMGAAGIFERIP